MVKQFIKLLFTKSSVGTAKIQTNLGLQFSLCETKIQLQRSLSMERVPFSAKNQTL